MSSQTKTLSGWIQNHIQPDHLMLILAALTGFLAGIASSVFRWMILVVETVFSAKGFTFAGLPEPVHPYLLVLCPMAGGLLIGIICRFFPYAVRENGVPQVIQAVALEDGTIHKRTLLTCSATTAITLGSGGSGGREGPIVHIGSTIGSAIGQLLNFSAKRVRVLLGCGAAAAIGATFNTPLAGVLFALEIILGDFTIRTFSPIIIASVIGTGTGWAMEGNKITFLVPDHIFFSNYEIIFYIVLGILCGLVARLFSKSFIYTGLFFDARVRIPAWLKPAAGGLAVGLIALVTPQVQGNGYPFMEDALHGRMFWGLALALVFLKIIATSVTIGSGGMGGIVAPSLFIGAMAGTVFGSGVHGLFPDHSSIPATYSMVGMAAVAGAVMQAPLTCILMVFELTNDYAIILPTMTSCIVSAYTYRTFTEHSIFIQQLLVEGVNIKYGQEVSVLHKIKVSEVMNPKLVTLMEDMPFQQIMKTISHSRNLYFPVTNKQGEMTGILSFSDIRRAFIDKESMESTVAGDLASMEVETLTNSNTLMEAMEKFSRLDVEQIPVVRKEEPKKVIGMLSRWDVTNVYNREAIVAEIEP